MKIPIQPTNVFVPGRGLVNATHLEVTVSQLELGQRARGHYTLQTQDLTDPAKPVFRDLSSGPSELTAEQFAQWGTDDTFFALCVVKNIGLTPA